jgi:hypothetical protein
VVTVDEEKPAMSFVRRSTKIFGGEQFSEPAFGGRLADSAKLGAADQPPTKISMIDIKRRWENTECDGYEKYNNGCH